MSAFLGPIHIKMYERILYQDAMSRAVLDSAAKNGWNTDLAAEVDSKAPAASNQQLETIIDQSNIHGWLSEAVARCERRFALAVCTALEGHPERMGELRSIMNALGKAYSLPGSINAEQAFQAIHDILLDGMPCDFPFVTTDSDSDAVVWKVDACPHAPYWTQDTCAVEIYYQLRDAWVDGALENCPISHSRPELYSHALRREGKHE